MILYAEAMMLLLPPELGGRRMPVAPRDGSYCPTAASAGKTIRVRVIEGPPRLMPGEGARVMVEVDAGGAGLELGHDLRLCEAGAVVGSLTVLRVCGEAVSQ